MQTMPYPKNKALNEAVQRLEGSIRIGEFRKLYPQFSKAQSKYALRKFEKLAPSYGVSKELQKIVSALEKPTIGYLLSKKLGSAHSERICEIDLNQAGKLSSERTEMLDEIAKLEPKSTTLRQFIDMHPGRWKPKAVRHAMKSMGKLKYVRVQNVPRNDELNAIIRALPEPVTARWLVGHLEGRFTRSACRSRLIRHSKMKDEVTEPYIQSINTDDMEAYIKALPGPVTVSELRQTFGTKYSPQVCRRRLMLYKKLRIGGVKNKNSIRSAEIRQFLLASEPITSKELIANFPMTKANALLWLRRFNKRKPMPHGGASNAAIAKRKELDEYIASLSGLASTDEVEKHFRGKYSSSMCRSRLVAADKLFRVGSGVKDYQKFVEMNSMLASCEPMTPEELKEQFGMTLGNAYKTLRKSNKLKLQNRKRDQEHNKEVVKRVIQGIKRSPMPAMMAEPPSKAKSLYEQFLSGWSSQV